MGPTTFGRHRLRQYKEFVFCSKSNRSALKDSQVRNDMFFKELSGCFIEQRPRWQEERGEWNSLGGYCSRVRKGDGDLGCGKWYSLRCG